jgi:ATP-binding cassette, subfamily B, bacterial PglK
MMNLKKNINIYKYYLYQVHSSGIKIYKTILLWSIVAGFVEMLSLGMVVPIIIGMLEIMENGSGSNTFISNLTVYISINNIFLMMILSIAIIFLVKIMFIKWFQKKLIFSANLYEADISTAWLEEIINWDYSKFILKDTGKLLRTITSDVSNSVHLVFLPSLGLVAEVISIIGVLIATYFISSTVFLIECAMVLVFLLFSYIKRSKTGKIQEYGKQQQMYESKRLLSAKSFFDSYKEMKVHKNDLFIVNHYREYVENKAYFSSMNQFIQQVPRLYVELALVLVIVSTLLTVYFLMPDEESIKTTIVVLIVGGMRVAPSFTKIISSISSISFGFQSLKWIVEDFKIMRSEKLRDSNPKEKKILSSLNWNLKLKNITLARGLAGKKQVFNNASLIISKGEKILVTGKSGSGKSTLIDLIVSLLSPDSGSIFIEESNVKYSIDNLKLSYIPQQFSLFQGDIDLNITFGMAHKPELVNKVSRITGIIGNIVPKDGHTRDFKILEGGVSLSGGQKQRIGIARALYREPELLILDEATNALDSESEKNILDQIIAAYPSMSILFISHNKNIEKNIFNKEILIHSGKIIVK